ncbi:TIGR01457 family HAD-type hydrolase [Virgibacillus halodenitrificans]|uniref:TIGR01457 family HAD-type hydrolase n=1 Tax=Virgibacillus halodenitrificans TaxID=1482 RepID=UPI002DB9AD4A|nr:TIGR01457 family HAD-type hydrolase [Virgibacillus halodenitrificans]MEC2159022.1 TIGR01457 family HAD-type hydrolase [Virgibacillus halodenitrificans]
MKQYKGYLIDLDGTMFRGEEPIVAAVEFIDMLNKKQLPYLFITNNSSKTQKEVSDKLNHLGIYSTPEHVVTTSIATAKYIKNKKQKANCYVIGETGINKALQEEGLETSSDREYDFVVVGIDRQINYEKYANACLAIQNGATFISTNSDVVIPDERGLLPGNGALTSVITVSTGQMPTFIGKPETVIMDEALSIINLSPEETLMVGDNYDTDILAGMNAGMDTLMAFTGVTTREQLSKKDRLPTHQVDNLSEWIERI